MQFNRYRFSNRSQSLLGQLKHRTGLGINVLARYGLCLSLKDPSIPNSDEFDEMGLEIIPGVLFGEHENIYMALIIDRLNRDGLDPKEYLHKMTRAHLNRGATALFPRIHDLSDFNYIIQQEQK
ncbi:MAG: DndE family protein [Nitrosopumilus sp.]|nr:DndE family protein [Nitrosopumilus sp.]NRA06464.1 DndE family protein [Nitrosopumilus sp.]